MPLKLYDIAIAGGGLAGLSLAIRMKRSGFSVALFEKETYPFHKVCGEYISLESRGDLLALGVPLDDWDLPLIHRLRVSAPGGRLLETRLTLGGFGVSRFRLDAELARIARHEGVDLYEGVKVNDILFTANGFTIETPGANYRSKLAFACHGKRSNLDVKWKRNFLNRGKDRLQNFIAVKYHVGTVQPPDTISLHNFSGGYCGISRIENGRYCLCYLTTAENLRRSGNSIAQMERTILQRNPHLRELFSGLVHDYRQPLTISQISFDRKNVVENHILFAGDAAGMITPLCGNGMSMALHASKIAAACAERFLTGNFTREKMEQEYVKRWRAQFAARLATGRFIQGWFGSNRATGLLLMFLKNFPRLQKRLIQATHGEPF